MQHFHNWQTLLLRLLNPILIYIYIYIYIAVYFNREKKISFSFFFWLLTSFLFLRGFCALPLCTAELSNLASLLLSFSRQYLVARVSGLARASRTIVDDILKVDCPPATYSLLKERKRKRLVCHPPLAAPTAELRVSTPSWGKRETPLRAFLAASLKMSSGSGIVVGHQSQNQHAEVTPLKSGRRPRSKWKVLDGCGTWTAAIISFGNFSSRWWPECDWVRVEEGE